VTFAHHASHTRRRATTVAAVGIVAALVGAAGTAHAQTATLDKSITVTGQGSSFVSNFVEQCKADAKNALGINISYQPTGSGAGRTAYVNGTNDFAGSDVAFNSSEASKAKPFVYIPVAIGGVAVVYKVPGVTELKMSAATIAKIFSGQVLKWSDAAIKAENPGAALPDKVIKVVVRSDSSGTSNVFSDYLSQAGKGQWPKGATSQFPVPAGNGIAQKGSDGVTNYVSGDQGDFSITYAETSFAEERKLDIVKIINQAGKAVLPTAEGVTQAMEATTVNNDGTVTLNFNPPGAAAYPISTTSYLIAPQTMDKAKGDILRTFLTYALTGCQSRVAKLGYAPIPKSIETLGLAAVAKINPGSAAVPAIALPGETATATNVTPTTTAKPATASAAPTSVAPTTTKPVAKTTVKSTVKKKTPTTKKK
jgi:phosphate transport system substrate-binding protein